MTEEETGNLKIQYNDVVCVETEYGEKHVGFMTVTLCDPECSQIRYNYCQVFIRSTFCEFKTWRQGIRFSSIKSIKIISKDLN